MAALYVCRQCSLEFELGADHLEDTSGNIAWLGFVYCESCGANMRILTVDNESTIEYLESLRFHNQHESLNWNLLMTTKSPLKLNTIQCQCCHRTGTIKAELVNELCPHCQKNSLELEDFSMT